MCMFTSSSPFCPRTTKEVPAYELFASYVFSLFSWKQIGTWTLLAGRKLVEEDTWGRRRGTHQLKYWGFCLTQAWLPVKVMRNYSCVQEFWLLKFLWRPCASVIRDLKNLSGGLTCASCQAEQVPTMMRHYFLPSPAVLCSLLWETAAPGIEPRVWTAPRASTLPPWHGKTTEFIYLSVPLPLPSTAGSGSF